ncbi:Aromatic-L-amino-acid decarboxylase [Fasciola gigantica]|uniref:Aromatic-L-amino-acid decarboxylase n=1 Tax=Fasciola gigantica TaxID=46835 RepID=A0A504YDW0_FASGI|nr:Aromatic-L-amino-acid decarboxylase [Fasciola gigantica]
MVSRFNGLTSVTIKLSPRRRVANRDASSVRVVPCFRCAPDLRTKSELTCGRGQRSNKSSSKMDSHQFCYWGKRMVDYICEYQCALPERRVIPAVQPGYLRPLLPEEAPEEGETWQQVFEDLEKYIVPGLTHWQHPSFYAYFPAANSVPSIMGDMLSAALGCVGFSWAASPAMTELEVVMMDWMARLLHLPKEFTHASGKGGGVIQTSASDCILVCMLAARHYAIRRHKFVFEEKGDHNPENAVLSRLVAYGSNLVHSSAEKASMICMVKFRQLDVDENYSLRGDALQAALEEDVKNGLIPFFVCATFGTTACCSIDELHSIGPVCDNFNVWLHLDGAYAGSAFILPEFNRYLKGIEHVWSMNVNPNKWMLVGCDCSLMWVRDQQLLTSSMVVDPIYLQHKHSKKTVDFRHWGIPLSRRFRALKLWFVLRIYGARGIREYIRRHIRLAQSFAELVKSDDRFELIGKSVFGLVCFRLKGSNTLNQYLTRALNESMELHVIPAVVNEIYFIRFAICCETCTLADVRHAWEVITLIAGEILRAQDALDQWRHYVMHKTGTDPAKRGLDELNTSVASAEDGGNDDQFWDKALIRGQADENLVHPMKQRLQELQELGATDAYNLLLNYLQNSGWELGEMEPTRLIHTVAEPKAENTSTRLQNSDSPSEEHSHSAKDADNSHLADTEDSGKYSISNGENSPEHAVAQTWNKKKDNSPEDCKSSVKDETTECTLRYTSSSMLRMEQFHSPFLHETFPSCSNLTEPNEEISSTRDSVTTETPTSEVLLGEGKTSSPIIEKTLTYPCYNTCTTQSQSELCNKDPNKIMSFRKSSSDGKSNQQVFNHSSTLMSNYTANMNSTAPELEDSCHTSMTQNNNTNSSIRKGTMSKSFDQATFCSFMPRRPALSHLGRRREAFVCERDLAVGSFNDRTLDRVHRMVLRKMISEPTLPPPPPPVRAGCIVAENGIQNRGGCPQIHSFLNEIVNPTNLGLNRSCVSKLGSVQLSSKSEVPSEADGVRSNRSSSDQGCTSEPKTNM